MLIRSVLAWFLLAVIGVANGVLRGTTYGRLVSERTAHQISTVTCVTGMFAGSHLLLRDVAGDVPKRTLLAIGAGWALATVVFEFGFGHFVARESWSKLARAYDLRTGQLWSAVPLAILVAPLLSGRLAAAQTERQKEAQR